MHACYEDMRIAPRAPLTQTSLQKLIEIAKDNVRWKQEIVRCMKRDL